MALTEMNLYVAVRRSKDGHERLDMSETGFTPGGASRRVAETREKIPKWAADNPVIGIACCIVKEVERLEVEQIEAATHSAEKA